MPPAWSRVTLLLLVMIATGAVFISNAVFARKETVRGRIRTTGVEARVFAPEPGLISQLNVRLGQHVQQGDVLAHVATYRGLNATTSVSEASMAVLRQEKQSLDERGQSLNAANTNALARAGIEIEAAHAEQEGLAASRSLIQERIALSVDRVATAEKLFEEGAASGEEVRTRKEAVIVLRQQLVDVETKLQSAQAREHASALGTGKLHAEHDQLVADLGQRQAQLELRTTEVQAGAGFVIKAPISGTIATLQAGPGERVDQSQPMLAILPLAPFLTAELFVPTRAIAFVEHDQPIRILYDALPYQKFGAATGRVKSISQTTLMPGELRAPIEIQEPVYRVEVSLDQQSINAFGRSIALHSGMELSADIILERRTLLEWALEPMFAFQKRGGP